MQIFTVLMDLETLDAETKQAAAKARSAHS